MIRLLFLTALMLSNVSASASADNSLALLKSMMPTVCHFSGEFSQAKQIKTLPIPLVSKGEFIYSCDLGLIWKTQEPVTESLIFTNQKLHFLIPEKLSIENLEGVQHDFLANLLLGLMAGNTEFIEKEFDLETIEAKNGVEGLSLIPKNKVVKQAILSVTLEKIDSSSLGKNGLQISITDKNLQVTRISSTEKQQYAKNDEFSQHCTSLSADGCELLRNPVRVSTSGQN